MDAVELILAVEVEEMYVVEAMYAVEAAAEAEVAVPEVVVVEALIGVNLNQERVLQMLVEPDLAHGGLVDVPSHARAHNRATARFPNLETGLVHNNVARIHELGQLRDLDHVLGV